MFSPKKEKHPQVEFNFPYTPYPIQQELMESLYQVLEKKKIGIFESPTGTGKSLTLTCSALKWQEDHEELVREELLQKIKETEKKVQKLDFSAGRDSDWLTTESAARNEKQDLNELRRILHLFEEHKQRISDRQERCSREQKYNFNKSGAENEPKTITYLEGNSFNDSDEDDDDNVEHTKTENIETPHYREVQIFFCSRTHSQLAQVLQEVKRSSYGQHVRCLFLASRKQLCINAAIKNLPRDVLNERCLDMARSSRNTILCENKKLKSITKCPYKQARPLQNLADIVLTNVLDIEELITRGKENHACPYYASRVAAADAQLVFLPYQMLLHKRTRENLGINLKGSVVIIDEAHNLLNTLEDLHSCTVSLAELKEAQEQINEYRQQYQNLFNAENLLRINQLLYVIKCLTNMFIISPKTNNESNNDAYRVFKSYELMSEADFFNISLFNVLRFCDRNSFVQKVQSFFQNNKKLLTEEDSKPPETTLSLLQRLQKQKQDPKATKNLNSKKLKIESENLNSLESYKTKSSGLRSILSFLEALTENAEDGRIILNMECETTKCFKYILLNPGRHFENVVHDARSVIMAGGTMQPTKLLTEQLFSKSLSRVCSYSYNHVVPKDSVITFVSKRGPCGHRLNFNFKQRTDNEMLGELGSILQNLCNVVPAGLVCFLPSYEYLEQVYIHLERTGVLKCIRAKKLILCENRLNGGDSVDTLLATYKSAALSRGGALLFSVISGKLSEGLNFTDDLGRGVIVVGMPYANRHTIEMKLRMEYLENKSGTGQSNQYYVNLCMKAVNQCIGRAVRHINDYACVFLLDERYSEPEVQNKLPHWITRSIKIADTFGPVQGATAKFFRNRKSPP